MAEQLMSAQQNHKLCVVGLGGVGGYIGAMLAHHLNQVSFYVRGDRLKSIQKNGLRIESKLHGNFTAYPLIASDDAATIGVMDYVILAVKHFSLEQVCADISPIIDAHTVVVPLLNGVGTAEKVRAYLGKGIVLEALIYIISEVTDAFTILHSSPYGNIHFGFSDKDRQNDSILTDLKALLDRAEVTCTIEEDIEAAIWRKYILNCAYNVVTSYYRANTGDIKRNIKAVEEFQALLSEGCLVARERNVNISPRLEEQLTNHLLYKQDEASTSSLNRDFLAGKETELEIFSGHMLSMAAELELNLPVTRYLYEELKKGNFCVVTLLK